MSCRYGLGQKQRLPGDSGVISIASVTLPRFSPDSSILYSYIYIYIYILIYIYSIYNTHIYYFLFQTMAELGSQFLGLPETLIGLK